MAIMKRGANVALTREIRHLRSIVVGVSINAGSEKVLTDNLVVATILCDASSKALSDQPLSHVRARLHTMLSTVRRDNRRR